jgi:ABC-type transport system involved in cytochrome bd biosynthesis fused ATPase/permease subunit
MFFDGFLIGGIPGGILLTYIFFRAFLDSIYIFKNIPELGFMAVIHILIFFCSFFEFQTGSSMGNWLFLTIVILRGVVLTDQIRSLHKESTAET